MNRLVIKSVTRLKKLVAFNSRLKVPSQHRMNDMQRIKISVGLWSVYLSDVGRTIADTGV